MKNKKVVSLNLKKELITLVQWFSLMVIACSSTVSALAYADALGEYVPLSILRRGIIGTSDRFTTISSYEASLFTTEGEIAYIPHEYTSTNTSPLFRLYNGIDHMESTGSSEPGGYKSESILGYPWNTTANNPGVPPGLTLLKRLYNTTTGDHATVHSTDLIGLNPSESLPGYGSDGTWATYCFARYNLVKEKFLTITGGSGRNKVTIQSNAVAGGALWSWKWNNTEFVNVADTGRQIQSAVIFIKESTVATGINPTEAGDAYAHGSPCVTLYNDGNGTRQVSRAVPLAWDPWNLRGGPDFPVVFTEALMGKDLYPNYQVGGVTRNWPVAQYVTNIKVPYTINTQLAEIPTGYMPYTFNRYYTYDAGNAQLTEVFPPDASTNATYSILFTPSSGYGGVIITNPTGTLAMGVYSVMVPLGGSATAFLLQKFNFGEANPSPTTLSTSKFSVIRGMTASNWSATQPINSGNNQYISWIMTGTLTEVRSYMNTLYSYKVK
jgi:hypothetical protein